MFILVYGSMVLQLHISFHSSIFTREGQSSSAELSSSTRDHVTVRYWQTRLLHKVLCWPASLHCSLLRLLNKMPHVCHHYETGDKLT